MPYNPTPPPRTKPELQEIYDYLEQELQSIAREMNETLGLDLRTTYQAPERPREGMIVQADGTSWNPGAGAGMYRYVGGAWVKFGNATHTHTLADITDDGALAALNQADVANIGPIATSRIIGRASASSGDAEELTLSQVLDFVGSAARGDLLVRGASTWARLGIGSANTFLKSDGTDPSWATGSGGWTSIQENSPTSGTNSDFTDIPANNNVLIFLGRQLDMSNGTGLLTVKFGTSNTFGAFHNAQSSGFTVTTSTVAGGSPGSPTSSISAGTNTTDATGSLLFMVFDYASTTRYKLWFSLYTEALSAGTFWLQYGTIETTSAIANVRFALSTGSWVGGTIALKGAW